MAKKGVEMETLIYVILVIALAAIAFLAWKAIKSRILG